MGDCLVKKVVRGKSCNLIFRILKKGSKRPFAVSKYSIKASYADVFGNVISRYSYSDNGRDKPIYVSDNTVTIPLTAKETVVSGRFDIFIEIKVDEHVNISIKKAIDVGNGRHCVGDVYFDIFISEILYEDGVTFVPHIDEEGVLSWTNNGGLENPEPVQLIVNS